MSTKAWARSQRGAQIARSHATPARCVDCRAPISRPGGLRRVERCRPCAVLHVKAKADRHRERVEAERRLRKDIWRDLEPVVRQRRRGLHD